MSAPNRVYYDVENTLHVPFISGIQRVVRQLSAVLTDHEENAFEFIPVVYCEHCNSWRCLSKTELIRLRRHSFEPLKKHIPFNKVHLLASRILSKQAKKYLRLLYDRHSHPDWHHQLLLSRFEPGSIFLDIDASWHNSLKRHILLPHLKSIGVYIAVIHYDIIPVLFPDMTNKSTYPIFTQHLRAHIENADLFICISRNSERDLIEYARREYPNREIHTTTIQLGANNFGSGHNIVSIPPYLRDRKYLLCVGTIEPRKNHRLILDAFDQLSDKYPMIVLVFVGREGWNSSETIDRILRNRHINHRLYWLSDVNDDTLSSLYRHALLTVVPSLYEGFGLPVTEALMYGCPTLSSDRGALREAGGTFVDYFNPEDTHAFTALLKSYLDGYKAEQSIIMLRSYVPPDWNTTANQLLDALNQNFFLETKLE